MICTGNIVNLRLFPSLVLALPLGNRNTFPLAFEHVCSFKFVDRAEDGQHHTSVRCRGVKVFFQAVQVHALRTEPINQFQQVLRAAADTRPVEHIHGIALTRKVEHLLQLRAIQIFAADLLNVPTLDIVFLQRLHLPRLVLLDR